MNKELIKAGLSVAFILLSFGMFYEAVQHRIKQLERTDVSERVLASNAVVLGSIDRLSVSRDLL